MSWYIEFEVENEEAEERFWDIINRLGKAARVYTHEYTALSKNHLIEAAIDLAKEMHYIE